MTWPLRCPPCIPMSARCLLQLFQECVTNMEIEQQLRLRWTQRSMTELGMPYHRSSVARQKQHSVERQQYDLTNMKIRVQWFCLQIGIPFERVVNADEAAPGLLLLGDTGWTLRGACHAPNIHNHWTWSGCSHSQAVCDFCWHHTSRKLAWRFRMPMDRRNRMTNCSIQQYMFVFARGLLGTGISLGCLCWSRRLGLADVVRCHQVGAAPLTKGFVVLCRYAQHGILPEALQLAVGHGAPVDRRRREGGAPVVNSVDFCTRL